MPELLQWTAHADLGARARAVLDFIDNADPCFLGLVAALLVFLGSRMVAGQPAVQGWGLRLAVVAFLVYGGYAWFSADPDASRPLGPLALRSTCVAAFVLALSWIVLPVLSFVHGHLRLAVAVFLVYCAWALIASVDLARDGSGLPLGSGRDQQPVGFQAHRVPAQGDIGRTRL